MKGARQLCLRAECRKSRMISVILCVLEESDVIGLFF